MQPQQKVDSAESLFLRSGSTSSYNWLNSHGHGKIDPFLTLSNLVREDEQKKPSFHDSRIKEYEIHGWLCLVAWFPLGFALIATKRYYKTRWHLMHHTHNLIGLAVTGITLGTCL